MEMTTLHYITVISAYLLGAVPFGFVLCKLAGYGDVRDIGSGNIGATNVLRTGNKALALIVLMLDAGKGALAVLIAREFVGPDVAALAGAAAFLGHCFPIYLKFKGGKGVATFFGTILAINWMIGLFCLLIWLGAAAIFRFSSLAGMLAAIAAPVLAIALADYFIMWVLSIIALVVVIRHHANLMRLFSGTEPKIGQKSKTKPADDDDKASNNKASGE